MKYFSSLENNKASTAAATVLSNMYHYKKLHKQYQSVRDGFELCTSNHDMQEKINNISKIEHLISFYSSYI